jgi:hypothetical protein
VVGGVERPCIVEKGASEAVLAQETIVALAAERTGNGKSESRFTLQRYLSRVSVCASDSTIIVH